MDQELKHVCKICSRSFPCGRSLGGHMRSHVINSSPKEENPNKKNKKKTSRFTDANGDALLRDKLCKECGKGFQSRKALCGHMKCHSDKRSNSLEVDSCTTSNTKPVVDGQSGDEPALTNRKKRSRRPTRYIDTSASSFSIAKNGSSSVFEIDQQEVAMCLIMLSKDVGDKGSGLISVEESPDENFELLEVGSSIRSNQIKEKEAVKFKKLRNGILEPTILGSEKSHFDPKQSGFVGSLLPRNVPNLKKSSKLGLGKNLMMENGVDQAELSKEMGVNSTKNLTKFECTACNKTFHSYQALGGHRASHNKIKGCFASKTDNADDIGETEISPDPTADANKVHECPICFKVFSSGQALGGHKRSHLINGGSEAKTHKSAVTQKPTPEIRDLLDLNLPAPVEKENNGHVGFKPWWVASILKHEPLLGLFCSDP